MTKILVADDEASLRGALAIILQKAGCDTCMATDGPQAIEMFMHERPDLVVLDVMMPRLSGIEVCEVLRAISPEVPLLMLSAKGAVSDKTSGLRAGADDYVVKPFDDEELLLRIEALLRRRSGGVGGRKLTEAVTVGDLTIDPLRCEVTLGGVVVALTPKEFQILALMADNLGRVFTRDDLIEAIWGEEYEDSSISIPVYIRRIRMKIEPDPSNPVHLKTVWRFGYKLE